jgi:hypothetical protein
MYLAGFPGPSAESSRICRSDKFRQARNGGWQSINSLGTHFPAANTPQADAASGDYKDTPTSDASDFWEHALQTAIWRLRLATVSGICSNDGAVAEWLKAPLC